MKSLFPLPALALVLLVGCANPGIVQMSPGVFELARDDHGGVFGNRDALKAGVIRDANAFADEKGKVAVPIAAKEHPMGMLADWASYDYIFKLVDRDSPEAKTPMLLVQTKAVRSGEFRNLGGKDVLYSAQPASAQVADPTRAEPPPAAAAANSAASRLLELKKLLDAGAITPAEYDAKKKSLLQQL